MKEITQPIEEEAIKEYHYEMRSITATSDNEMFMRRLMTKQNMLLSSIAISLKRLADMKES